MPHLLSHSKCERFLPGAAALTLCVGIAALVCDFFDMPQPRVFNMHLLFGVAVGAVLTVCLCSKRLALTPGTRCELYPYARRVTRWTYILLYVLALVRVGLHLLEMGRASGTSGIRIHSLDDFQIYIAYCVSPLWLVRTLVLRWPPGASQVEEGRPEPAATPGAGYVSYFTL
jgi:hypothetical protein